MNFIYDEAVYPTLRTQESMRLNSAGDLTKRSGVKYTSLCLSYLISWYSSPMRLSSFYEFVALERLQAGIPRASTNCKLSSIRLSKGITTNVTPLSVTADS